MFNLLIKINFLEQSRKVWYLDKNYAVNNIDFYLNVGEKEYLKHIIFIFNYYIMHQKLKTIKIEFPTYYTMLLKYNYTFENSFF